MPASPQSTYNQLFGGSTGLSPQKQLDKAVRAGHLTVVEDLIARPPRCSTIALDCGRPLPTASSRSSRSFCCILDISTDMPAVQRLASDAQEHGLLVRTSKSPH